MGEPKKTTEINYQFKVLYSIGILFIVVGHCGENGLSLAYEWFPLYSFHVPLWMFCSGYFYHPINEKTPWKYIKHKVLKLLIPLYFWNLIYGMIVMLLRSRGFTIGEPLNWYSLLIMPWIDGHQFAFNLGGWFIAPLIMIEVAYLFWRKLFCFLRVKNESLLMLFGLAVGMIGVSLSAYIEASGLGLMILRFLVLFPFYGGGYFYKAKLEKKDKLPNLPYFGIVFAAQICMITKYGEPLTYLISWCKNLQKATPVTPYIVACIGIAFWLRVSKVITPILMNSKVVMLMADHTFDIMLHHMMGFMVIKTFFALLHRLFGLFPDFNTELYKSSVWYNYYPINGTYFSLIYIVFGIAFSLVIAYLGQKGKEMLKTCKMRRKEI